MNPDRYFNVKKSWGKNVDCLFYSDHEDEEKNTIQRKKIEGRKETFFSLVIKGKS
jgi:hypothetical protein